MIKTINQNWNAFLGVGLGFNYYSESDRYYNNYTYFDNTGGLATEIGIQWITGRFHVLAGLNLITNFEDDGYYKVNSRVNIDPFVGVGFSF